MSGDLLKMLLNGTKETLYMVSISSIIALILGIPIGISLVVTDKGGIYPLIKVNKVIGIFINIIRSMPEMILIIILSLQEDAGGGVDLLQTIQRPLKQQMLP